MLYREIITVSSEIHTQHVKGNLFVKRTGSEC